MKPSDLPKGTLISYHRDKTGLRGVVVALDNNILGWSLCHKNDRFDKGEGLRMAYEKAMLAFRLNKKVGAKVLPKLYSRVPRTLKDVFDKHQKRSQLYFKPEIPKM